MKKRFIEEFNEEAKYLCRSPGRVNLIGEHIDYMGYGVLPFAIEKDSVILYRENSDNIIRIRHEDNTKY